MKTLFRTEHKIKTKSRLLRTRLVVDAPLARAGGSTSAAFEIRESTNLGVVKKKLEPVERVVDLHRSLFQRSRSQVYHESWDPCVK